MESNFESIFKTGSFFFRVRCVFSVFFFFFPLASKGEVSRLFVTRMVICPIRDEDCHYPVELRSDVHQTLQAAGPLRVGDSLCRNRPEAPIAIAHI